MQPSLPVFSQASIGKLNSVYFSASAMPGDPAVLEGVSATLSAVNLLNFVAVKFPPFWPDNIET